MSDAPVDAPAPTMPEKKSKKSKEPEDNTVWWLVGGAAALLLFLKSRNATRPSTTSREFREEIQPAPPQPGGLAIPDFVSSNVKSSPDIASGLGWVL